MKKWVLSIVLSGVILSSVGQDKMSSALIRSAKTSPSTWQKVVVIGTEKIDVAQFVEKQKSNNHDPQKVTSLLLAELKKQSKFQEDWINELQDLELPFEINHRFWSINVVVISAPQKTLNHLAKHPDVYWMEKTTEKTVEWHKPVSMAPVNQRSVNGSEQGILAVRANELWQMGYSGRGSKLLTFDTGVWPYHPQFRDQFLGSHVPLNQAWFGYDTYLPGDKSNSHGTHVTGTCMGLDPANSDTIGVAFNAYFMATDPIVQNLANLKTMEEIFRGYEWAMNPDGDINTTSDMPHVINNSWGRPSDPADSVVCDGWVSDMLVNMEALNIISIHSAGNSGPNMSTIGVPAIANVSVVNNFSVGAVNGHTASFPIASFSSRGPTICGDTGSLLIKPEVVGPGVNVRSAIRDIDGTYNYSNFQGTSMSAPHVSGVALLLREAFPLASAKEIKEAMYYSAVDLGAVGEDNIYGNGMVDAVASFNYLSNLYTPMNPNTNNFDIHPIGFDIEDYSSQCDLTEITAYFDNSQDMPGGNVFFDYGVLGHYTQYKAFGNGTFFTNDSVKFTVDTLLQPGWNEFYIRAYYTGGNSDIDTINDSRYVRFWVAEERGLPYSENFDSVHVFESSLFVENPDERVTWDTAVAEGISGISNTAVMKFSSYSPRLYQHDMMQTPNLKLSPTTTLTLQFDLSYQYKFSGFADSLSIQVSTNCGTSWDAAIYSKNPDSLNTTSKPYTAGSWVPTEASDWRTETVDLSSYIGASNIMVRFISANGQGNYLYLDNINIYDDNGIASVKTSEKEELTIYPNPNNTGVIHFSKSISGVLYTLSGVEIKRFNNQSSLNMSTVTKGVYLLRNNDTNIVYKVILD